MGVLGSILGAATSGIGNIISTSMTNKSNERLTRESWARDDTAVQRKAEDMKAAGINPLMAAGASAQNSAPIPMKAPEIPDFGSAFVTGKQAEIQERAQEVQGNIADATINNLKVQNRILNLDEAQKANDLLLNINRRTRSNDSGMFNQVMSGLEAAMNAWRIHSGPITRGLSKNVLEPVTKYVRDNVVEPIQESVPKKVEKRESKETTPVKNYKTDGTGAK